MAATAKTKKKSAAVKKTKKAPVKKTAAKTKPVKKSKSTASSKGTAKPVKTVSKVSVKNENKVKKAAKPSGKKPEKTYLNDKELEFFRELIIEQKTEILENARRLRESLIDENTGDYVGDNSTFSMHMAEQGTDEMEREKLYMFIQRDEKHLFYLENALERIAKKTYGLCISCGKSINKARLEAVPITSHCINCKQNLSS
ncbi:MAG TPA: TraR/DksA C4-type zinc finger protein [Ignavibacteria bacterium]|nr:TraR/DksA C4-type zinc finger protein [Ignavibacteria bacterium]